MAYRLQIQHFQGYVRIQADGERHADNVAENALQFWHDLVDVCNGKDSAKVLVVSNVQGKYPAEDALWVNSRLEALGVDRRWKIAFVNFDMESQEDVKFAETINLNRGFWIKVFPDEQTAIAWLDIGN